MLCSNCSASHDCCSSSSSEQYTHNCNKEQTYSQRSFIQSVISTFWKVHSKRPGTSGRGCLSPSQLGTITQPLAPTHSKSTNATMQQTMKEKHTKWKQQKTHYYPDMIAFYDWWSKYTVGLFSPRSRAHAGVLQSKNIYLYLNNRKVANSSCCDDTVHCTQLPFASTVV